VVEMTKISEARERYEEKVCEEYLGIPESYCADEFSKIDFQYEGWNNGGCGFLQRRVG